MEILVLLAIMLMYSYGVPINNRCFEEGVLVDEQQNEWGIAEICVKDDISMVKTLSKQHGNTSRYTNIVMRRMLIQNYENCNPVEVPNGPIMIFKPDKNMVLVPHTYACRSDCTISLDKDDASIILHSENLNHFEVMGTTTATRWFQGSTSYSLEHTCEHIQVTCGSKILTFHACFKHHMACIRLLNKSYMPAFMINSVCQNKELIIMTCLILIIFSILYLISFTYICYILLPVFIPVTYIYAKFYDKFCKKCVYCGLAYHPFSKCGKNCVCGSLFENSERMKMHREAGLCKGYKYMRSARVLCKNKGSNFSLAIILAVLLLSFIQPIEGVKLTYNRTEIPLESLSHELDKMVDLIHLGKVCPMIMAITVSVIMLITITIWLSSNKLEEKYLSKYLYYCNECEMTHPRVGLKFYLNGDFTNKCNSCMCGVQYDQEAMNNDPDYVYPKMHQITVGCYAPAKYYTRRALHTATFSYSIIMLIICLIISGTFATESDKCLQPTNFRSVSNPIHCSVWAKAKTCTPSLFSAAIQRTLILKREEAYYEKMHKDLMEILHDTERSDDPFKSFLLEDTASKVYCNEIKTIDQATRKYNIKFKELIKKSNLEICSQKKAVKICACFEEGSNSNCDPDDTMGEVVTFYTTHKNVYHSDVRKIVTAIIEVFPGLAAKEFMIAMNQTKYSSLKTLTETTKGFFTLAKGTKAALALLCKAVADSTLENETIPKPLMVRAVESFPTTWKTNSIFANMAEASDVKECNSPSVIRCSLPFSARLLFYINCDSQNNKFYQVVDGSYAYKQKEEKICAADSFCDRNLDKVPVSDKEKLMTLSCIKITPDKSHMPNSVAITKCKKVATHTCKYKTKNVTFVECLNGLYYEYDELFQSPREDIGVYCFHKSCSTKRYGHHPSNLAECTNVGNQMQSKSLRKISYEDIEHFKHSLEESIKTDLVEHKYILTENLPHVIPAFRPVSIQGVEVDSGIQSSYIETNVQVQTGLATGLKVRSKDGQELFDLIVFVKSAHYEVAMEEIYKTGPTIGMNVQHNEKCTGSCPENISKAGWLSFSKERTSRWGCEEFGCLAIDEGCVWGTCQDIIKPDMTIIRKATTERPSIEVCISLPDGSYCHPISNFNSIITDKVELQFISNEAGRIPKLMGYKSNKVLTGMINDIGTFSKMCGSVQLYNKTMNGAGNAKFDYLCHSAKRKEIVVTRCFDNFYGSCLLLKPEESIIYDPKEKRAMLLNRLMGEIRLKIKLGDLAYKTYEQQPSFDFKASCVGCLDCLEGVHCQLDIISTIETVCRVDSSCSPIFNNIRITPETTKYGMKFKCRSPDLSISLCGNKVEVQISIISAHDTVQVGNSDQTYYIKENDLRCSTWLCRVKDQGISAIFGPIFSIFGKYADIAIYTIIGIVILLITIYFLLPVCARVKDIMVKNEIEYLRESKGIKTKY
ncbi:polyprotein [Pacora virus]|uniref:Envelopment polyprotein n=1 Tax=Pacora virus TaxID=2748244 RepID=A0A7D9MVW1_9VIRU|nr:polyprotein [Pacora virus]QLA47047.1 polyprotein [Pacora virus]